LYNLPHFKAANSEDVVAFMKANPFIMLCGCDADGQPVATHVPVLFEERNDKIFLHAHIMRKQDHTIAFEQNQKVLAIFHSPHTYVSASWYAQKNIGSTWNYQAVHTKGVLKFLDDVSLHKLLTSLTEKFENNPHSPSLVQNLDKNYVANMMKAIIAFEIEIISIEHVFKLSQNRDEKSYENIEAHLKEQDAGAKYIAEEMMKNKENVFGE
jgi:transcriptional regulator